MKTRAIVTLGLTALVACGALAGITSHGGIAFASARDESRAERKAATEAGKARAALAKGKGDQAVFHAEAAVGLRPQVASFRVLLANSYLRAGRFDSARQAFTDAMTLDPGNGKLPLNLALAQIATGDWAGARQTLDTHKDIIPVSDRGLAMALAGDPASAVELLNAAVRAPDADAKTRQNFALSLALAGRWQEARTMASFDLAPDEVDQRIMHWAEFARPKSAYDQVASLLGVTPVRDSGQPVALALNAPSTGTALAAAAVDAFMPGQAENAAQVAQDMGTPVPAAPVAEVAIAVAPVEATPGPAPAFASVVFGPREEIVQRLPSNNSTIVAPRASVRVASAKVAPVVASVTRAPAKGNFFVQLGAYQNAAVAKDAWGRAVRSNASFASQTPSGMSITSKAGSFYRLSVGGFARSEADALCQSYKAKGGTCFVRAHAGDQVALWARPAGRQMASR
jgi:Flp pilus assembly protein TadD